mmetsp:Transcript_19245/g.34365  ORF Transcript_19245/g.34365 Transcript_19245/m.34365 type:complete len:83 (-) Transcript_19245:518-766(-)
MKHTGRKAAWKKTKGAKKKTVKKKKVVMRNMCKINKKTVKWKLNLTTKQNKMSKHNATMIQLVHLTKTKTMVRRVHRIRDFS